MKPSLIDTPEWHLPDWGGRGRELTEYLVVLGVWHTAQSMLVAAVCQLLWECWQVGLAPGLVGYQVLPYVVVADLLMGQSGSEDPLS